MLDARDEIRCPFYKRYDFNRRAGWHLLGRDGVRVAIYQDFYAGNRGVRREEVSDDTCRPISRAEWTMP